MTTPGRRWDLALRAHAAEHAALRERGLGATARLGCVGRGLGCPGVGRAWQSWARSPSPTVRYHLPAARRAHAHASTPYANTATTYNARGYRHSTPYANTATTYNASVRGLGELTPGSKLVLVGLVGIAVGAGAIFAFDRLVGPVL